MREGVEGAVGLPDAARSQLINSNIESLRDFVPRNGRQLQQYLQFFLELSVPNKQMCPGHSSPMDYLWHSFSCDISPEYGNAGTHGLKNADMPECRSGDCIVWANRAGGKTQLAAVATLLEGLFKQGCQTRIIAGSLDQSGRMYEYLRQFVEYGFEDLLDGKMLKESCAFQNGTTVQILPQSSAAVRGRHIHKLRCDEIEMFDADVFKAAQFVTQSTNGRLAAMEMLSTMHKPYGLMQKIIDQSVESGVPVFKWCMWEVIEPCPADRSCGRCALWSDCGGKAREGVGYLKIDDCISQMRRSSRAGFEAEMLCLRPNLENAVFSEFDLGTHVAPVSYNPTLPLYRAIDFGFVNPFVCLWIQVDAAGTVRVIDEYVKSKVTIASHAEVLKVRTPCDESQVAGTFCDPAGAGRNDVTGTSATRELAASGIRTRCKRSGIQGGLEKIRAHLRNGGGESRLVIDPRCVRLIEAMRCYHYPEGGKYPSELPEKDGVYDHPIDALRYFFANFSKSKKGQLSRY